MRFRSFRDPSLRLPLLLGVGVGEQLSAASRRLTEGERHEGPEHLEDGRPAARADGVVAGEPEHTGPCRSDQPGDDGPAAVVADGDGVERDHHRQGQQLAVVPQDVQAGQGDAAHGGDGDRPAPAAEQDEHGDHRQDVRVPVRLPGTGLVPPRIHHRRYPDGDDNHDVQDDRRQLAEPVDLVRRSAECGGTTYRAHFARPLSPFLFGTVRRAGPGLP